jgi:tripartite-type tricarboxylate transporter receptor subunit TctC
MRRAWLILLVLLNFGTLAHAQNSRPDRPIKFIVNVAARGGVDLNARIPETFFPRTAQIQQRHHYKRQHTAGMIGSCAPATNGS